MVVAIVQYNAVDPDISGRAYDTIKAMTNKGLGTPNELSVGAISTRIASTRRNPERSAGSLVRRSLKQQELQPRHQRERLKKTRPGHGCAATMMVIAIV